MSKYEDDIIELRIDVAQIKTMLSNHLKHHEKTEETFYKFYFPVALVLGQVVFAFIKWLATGSA